MRGISKGMGVHVPIVSAIVALPIGGANTAVAAAPAPVTPPSIKRFVEAELPPAAALKDVDVAVLLTIDAKGVVSKVVITKSGGEPFDAAAVAALKKTTFNPAKQGDVAIAVQVPFTYRFRIPRRRGRMVTARRPRTEKEKAPGRIYVGEVLEMGSRTPMAGVAVLATDPRTKRTFQAITEADGSFVLEGLPPGQLDLAVVTPDHDLKASKRSKTIEGVPLVKGAKPPESLGTVWLNPKAYSKFKTIVKENRRKAAAAEITLSKDELTKVPGTFGDPTRVIATLPGVARSTFGLGYYIVRGASTENTGFFIDGHPAGYLYHLGGGPGVLHPALVDKIRFYPSGYPANYGRYAGGAIAVETKEPPDDRWHLDVEIDITKAAVLFSVPFDDKKGEVTFSIRQSYLELLLMAIDDSITLRYTDYQARVRYDISPELRWDFYVMGAEDLFSIEDPEGGSGFGVNLGFHRVRTSVAWQPSKKVRWETSLAFEWDHTDAAQVVENQDGIDIGFEQWFLNLRSTLKIKASEQLRFEVGLDALYQDLNAGLRFGLPNPLGQFPQPQNNPVYANFDVSDDLISVAPFLFMDWEPIKGFRLLPSIRLSIDEWGGGPVVTVDPKLAVRATVHDQVTLKAMVAMAHQPPAPIITAEPFGDASLPPVTAYQASLGFEWRPTKGWEISVEGFYNHYQNMTQGGGTDNELDSTLWRSDLTGRAYGLEVMIRKEFGDWVYGWLSYTLSRAERKPRPNEEWELYSVDQTHILNLAWTFVLPGEWSIGARFQFTSGNPHNPVVGAKYDADADSYRPRRSETTSRLPFYHRLDLRIDKRIRFSTFFMEIFLDIQNVYNAGNPESLRYSFDYSVVTDGLGTPILPTLGMRFAF